MQRLFLPLTHAMILYEPYRALPHDVDMSGRMKVSALMRYMEETAYRHMNKAGPTAESLRAKGQAFLLARTVVEVYAELRHGDEFEVGTWAENTCAGVSFGRAFSVRRGDVTVARSKTVWTLYDFCERRIIRVRDFPSDYMAEEPIDMELPRRLTLPETIQSSDLVKLDEKRVEYGDIDENRHMNNTVYADMFCGCVPEICSGEARVKSIFINYSHECSLGGKIEIEGASDGGVRYFRSKLSDGTLNAEAKVVLA